jgi:ribonuclease-3
VTADTNLDFQSQLPGLDYRFQNNKLLRLALTHRSASRSHNERLEFLGDALLGAIVADALYSRFPKVSEGDLTRFRAELVREETLASLARVLNIGDLLQLGPGELKSGGYRRDSILADAFEALIAAIFLDGGFDACRTAILPLLDERMQKLATQGSHKDSKTQLQEIVQAQGHELPSYTLLDTVGDDHQKTFFARCTLANLAMTFVGEGGSRRAAEMHAAQLVLEYMKQNRISE